jgi:hypothetical protein
MMMHKMVFLTEPSLARQKNRSTILCASASPGQDSEANLNPFGVIKIAKDRSNVVEVTFFAVALNEACAAGRVPADDGYESSLCKWIAGDAGRHRSKL